ncbi:MAG TPA: phosphoribosylglycinamide formyltransferase [Gemmatimonadales bacterium]|nr:phosphoribosylglycinamide formyltransferase [Gemmatimonadales bacterium]
MTYRVVVAASGRGSNLLALGDALARRPEEAAIVAVLSDRDAPALELARQRGWPAIRLLTPAEPLEMTSALRACRADLLVLAGYLRLIPSEVVQEWQGRIINIHPSLLPRHGGVGMYGRRVHAAVLAAGDTTSGATVHLVDEVFDRGEILAQGTVPVRAEDSPESLAARVLEVEHRLLPKAVLVAAEHRRPVAFTLD